MPLPEEAQRSWLESAESWQKFVSEGDLNRTHLLDAVMVETVGDVAGKRVLDIGCGEGRFCRMLAERGAHISGVDLTEPLVQTARRLHSAGTYFVENAESLSFPNASFDLAISYLVLIDIPDYIKAIQEMARILRHGGRAVVANINPFAGCGDGWERDEDGRKQFFKIDRYFEERGVRYTWRGMSIINWHRPLQNYMQAFLEAGLRLDRYLEPKPTAEVVTEHPYMADGLRIPFFNVMVWSKP